jgi:hypothetical protein
VPHRRLPASAHLIEQLEALADRILIGPELLGKDFVDDRHAARPGRLALVVFGERALSRWA